MIETGSKVISSKLSSNGVLPLSKREALQVWRAQLTPLSIQSNRSSKKPPKETPTASVFCSDGSYGADPGLISSFPMRTVNGELQIVQNLPIDDFSRSKIDATVAELREEKEASPTFLTKAFPRSISSL